MDQLVSYLLAIVIVKMAVVILDSAIEMARLIFMALRKGRGPLVVLIIIIRLVKSIKLAILLCRFLIILIGVIVIVLLIMLGAVHFIEKCIFISFLNKIDL